MAQTMEIKIDFSRVQRLMEDLKDESARLGPDKMLEVVRKWDDMAALGCETAETGFRDGVLIAYPSQDFIRHFREHNVRIRGEY